MQKKIINKLTIIAIAICILGVCSCAKEDINLSDLDETIFVRHKNADMPAHIYGNGSEGVFLIILHGGPGGHGLSYRFNTLITEIEQNNAVVYFDQRGSGNSQGNYSEEDVSINLMAEDVLALAKVIKAKFGEESKLFLLGHSWGGVLGTATLLKNQEDFSGWIDLNGVHDPKGAYDKYKTVFMEVADEQIALENSVDFWLSVIDLVQSVGDNFSLEDFYKLNAMSFEGEIILENDNIINQGFVDFGGDATLNNPITLKWNEIGIAEILDVKIGLWEKISFTDRLSEITIPSLILWGKYDLVVPAINAPEAFDNLGSFDKELFIFEKSGHSPMASEPDLFADKVIEFINSH